MNNPEEEELDLPRSNQLEDKSSENHNSGDDDISEIDGNSPNLRSEGNIQQPVHIKPPVRDMNISVNAAVPPSKRRKIDVCISSGSVSIQIDPPSTKPLKSVPLTSDSKSAEASAAESLVELSQSVQHNIIGDDSCFIIDNGDNGLDSWKVSTCLGFVKES